MTRLAFLRSIETQQTRPFLREASTRLIADGVTPILIYTDGDIGSLDFDGESLGVGTSVRAQDLLALIRELRIDSAVSISIPDNSSVRDAAIRELTTADPDLTVVAHSLEIATTFADKQQTKVALSRGGVQTPPAVYVDGDVINGRAPDYHEYAAALENRVSRLGYPVIVKPIWDCLANGMSVLEKPSDLHHLLQSGSVERNVLIEKCVSGRLCSIEVITSGTSAFVQPIVWKGSTGAGPEFAFEQVRVAGVVPPELTSVLADLTERIRAVSLQSGVLGALEFEFIEDRGDFYCIEVNPRVSGSTGMSIAASGVNTYWELARIALDARWRVPAANDSPHVAWQLPLALDDIYPSSIPPWVEVLRDNSFCIDGADYASILLRIGKHRSDEFTQWCRDGGGAATARAERVFGQVGQVWSEMSPHSLLAAAH